MSLLWPPACCTNNGGVYLFVRIDCLSLTKMQAGRPAAATSFEMVQRVRYFGCSAGRGGPSGHMLPRRSTPDSRLAPSSGKGGVWTCMGRGRPMIQQLINSGAYPSIQHARPYPSGHQVTVLKRFLESGYLPYNLHVLHPCTRSDPSISTSTSSLGRYRRPCRSPSGSLSGRRT